MITLPSRISADITAKFAVEQNTLKRVVKAAPERKIETEIGDAKEIDFKPQVKTQWFNNEYNVSVRAEEDPLATVTTEGEKIVYTRSDGIKVVQYDKPDAGDEGGHELEWEIPSMPKFEGDFYRLKFTLRYKGNVKFYYQPALTQEEIDEGASRPENVEGSYAVYVDKSWHKLGSNNYATGKIEHIYRPKAIDAEGNEAWCTLYIPDQGQAETNIEGWVDVPRSFLEKVDYSKGPAVVDPTFGYTSIGLSNYSNYADRILAAKFASPGAGSASKITVYVDRCGASTKAKGAFYKNSDGYLETNGVGDEITLSASSWNDLTYSTPASITAIDYDLSIGFDYVSATVTRYDTGDENQGGFYSSTYPTFPNPITLNRHPAKRSIYATYTAAPSATLPTLTTEAATNLTSTTATGNGTVTDDGDADITRRGFVVHTSTLGDPGDTDPDVSSYSLVFDETGTFGAEAFDLPLTGLSPSTTYYIRAFAENSEGFAYGDEESFATTAASIARPSHLSMLGVG